MPSAIDKTKRFKARFQKADVPPEPAPTDFRARRLAQRKTDVAMYMALFPFETNQAIAERFGVSAVCLKRWAVDPAFLAAFERGMKARESEQTEAARGFFQSRLMSYVQRLDWLAMQDTDKRTAFNALVRILESQNVMEPQVKSIMNVAIQLQRGLEAAYAAPTPVPVIEITGRPIAGKEERDYAEGYYADAEGESDAADAGGRVCEAGRREQVATGQEQGKGEVA